MNNELKNRLPVSGNETDAQAQIRDCLYAAFEDQDPIVRIQVAGELIEYIRDNVLSALATVRRSATVTARSSMSPDDIAKATRLSRATVSRLITEFRNV
jgi:hypothetical protein